MIIALFAVFSMTWSYASVDRMSEPLPPSIESLDKISKIVEAASNALAQPPLTWQMDNSWCMVWDAESFGSILVTENASRFRFRVPPDASFSVNGRSPMLESYENGLPLFSIGGTGRARPLGFRYGADGFCTNVSIRVWEKRKWRDVRLSKRETTIMGRFLSVNEYSANSNAPGPLHFGIPWIRITMKGVGDYWIDQDLGCVGPFGAHGRLIAEIKNSIQDLLSGGYAKLKSEKAS